MAAERNIRVGVVAVIQNDQKEILMMLRNREPAKGQWAIPGGTLEMYENTADCIIREMKEELDIDVTVEKLLGNIEDINQEKNLHWVMPCYLVKIVSGTIINKEPEKHEKIEWFSLEKAQQINISFMTNEALKMLK